MRKTFSGLVFRALLIVPAVWLVLSDGGIHAQEGKAAVDLKMVKYDQLVEAVKAHRGKVIVVDVWAEY